MTVRRPTSKPNEEALQAPGEPSPCRFPMLPRRTVRATNTHIRMEFHGLALDFVNLADIERVVIARHSSVSMRDR